MKAQMIHKGQAPGTPLDVLALIEAIPPDERDPNCDYLLGKIYMRLDEENPNDEHAARAWRVGRARPRRRLDSPPARHRGDGVTPH